MDLPDEMLIKIFGRSSNLLHLTTVCKRFNGLVSHSQVLMKRLKLYWLQARGICPTRFLPERSYYNIEVLLPHAFNSTVLDALEHSQNTLMKLKVTFQREGLYAPFFHIPKMFQDILRNNKWHRLRDYDINGPQMDEDFAARRVQLGHLKELEIYNENAYELKTYLQFEKSLMTVNREGTWVDTQNYYGRFGVLSNALLRGKFMEYMLMLGYNV